MSITTLQSRIAAFSQLGKVMNSLGTQDKWPGFECGINQEEYGEFEELIEKVIHHNGWYTPENVRKALSSLSQMLQVEKMEVWMSKYTPHDNKHNPSRIGIIMAGNLPLVGFHDFLCVLISGNKAVVKMSSDDQLLLPLVFKTLCKFLPEIKDSVEFCPHKINDFDAVIATGSNNTARYFKSYFGAYPHIIRKNRNSVAILEGSESEEELKALASDIFDYFGLGCRNVSKIFIPKNYKLDTFFQGIYQAGSIVEHNKYTNNYDYNKAVWLLNQHEILDNGFVLLKEDEAISSPTGTLFYERYNSRDELEKKLASIDEQLQCVVASDKIPFGKAQHPELWDYADKVDTMEFILNVKPASK